MGWIRFSFHQKVFVSYMCVCWHHHHHHQEHHLYVIIGVYVYCVISYQWLWFDIVKLLINNFFFVFCTNKFFFAIFNRNFYVNLYFFITHAFSSNNSIFLFFFKTRLIRKKKLIKFTQIYKSMINGCGSVWLTTHIYVKLAWNTVILFLSYN